MTALPLQRALAALAFLGALLAPGATAAQQTGAATPAVTPAVTASAEPLSDSSRSSVLTGRVTSSEGTAIAGAEVTLLRDGRSARTDAEGSFSFPSLPSGPTLFLVRRIGFVAGNFTVILGAAERRRVLVSLEVMPLRLAEVRVYGARAAEFKAMSSRHVDFNQRRALGNGHFWNRADLAKFSPQSMSEIFRRTPGLRLARDRSGRMILSARGNSAGASCPMRLFVDGFSVPLFGLSIDDFVQVVDVEGIEVYSGLGTIPAQFGGRGPSEDSRCGVVVVWTRVE